MKIFRILTILTLFLSTLYESKLSGREFDMKSELKRLAALDTFPNNKGFYNIQGIQFYKDRMKKVKTESDLYFAHFDPEHRY